MRQRRAQQLPKGREPSKQKTSLLFLWVCWFVLKKANIVWWLWCMIVTSIYSRSSWWWIRSIDHKRDNKRYVLSIILVNATPKRESEGNEGTKASFGLFQLHQAHNHAVEQDDPWPHLYATVSITLCVCFVCDNNLTRKSLKAIKHWTEGSTIIRSEYIWAKPNIRVDETSKSVCATINSMFSLVSFSLSHPLYKCFLALYTISKFCTLSDQLRLWQI